MQSMSVSDVDADIQDRDITQKDPEQHTAAGQGEADTSCLLASNDSDAQ